MRVEVDRWVIESPNRKYHKLKLSTRDWEQVYYLIGLLEPFSRYTKVLSKGCESGPTIHMVWHIYNDLFDHLEKQKRAARGDWKASLRDAIKKAETKFKKYYGETENPKGELLAVAAVLHPGERFRAYETRDWTAAEKRKYKKFIIEFYEEHYLRYEPARDAVVEEPREVNADPSQICRGPC